MKLHKIPANTKIFIAKDTEDNRSLKFIDYTTKEEKIYFVEEFYKIQNGYHIFSEYNINGVKRNIQSEFYSIVRKDGFVMLIENCKVDFYCNI